MLFFAVFGVFLVACEEEDSGCTKFEETYTAAIFVYEPADWVDADSTLVRDDRLSIQPSAVTRLNWTSYSTLAHNAAGQILALNVKQGAGVIELEEVLVQE